jgi:type I restriction enzyme S subunit
MKKVKLGELILSDESGFACSKTKLVKAGLPHLRPFNIDDSGFLNLEQLYQVPESEAPNSKTQLSPGDILFNNTNSAELVGKSVVIRKSMRAGYSNHLTRIRVDNNRLEPEWLGFWLRRLRSVGFFTSNATQWVSQAAYRTADLRKIEICLPSISDQRRDIDLLSRAEAIAQLRRDAQRKTAELAPAIFRDMFGDPASNEKGWARQPFGSVGALDRGRSRHRPRDASHLYGGPYPFIQTGDVANSGGLIEVYGATYSEAGLKQSKLWPEGTLCITIAANIAKTGVLTFKACFPDSVVGFLPGSHVTTAFVQGWLAFLQPTLEANAPQAAQKNINLEILRNLPIPMPPIEKQKQYEERSRQIVSIRLQQDVGAKKAEAVFHALTGC